MSKIKFFVNGDSHTARVYPLGTDQPTAADILAQQFDLDLENLALPGGSNQRIIRTTLERLPNFDPKNTVIMIGWTSFERTEWYHSGQWHAVINSMEYGMPDCVRQQARAHITAWNQDLDRAQFRMMQEQHAAIWNLHRLLMALGFQHMFYQACDTMFFDGCPEQDEAFTLPWQGDTWLHDPYVICEPGGLRRLENFSSWCRAQGFAHCDQYQHFGADAHRAWAVHAQRYLAQKLQRLTAK